MSPQSATPLLDALAGDPEIEGVLSDAAQVAAIVRFEVALARASATAGLIAPAAGAAIEDVASRFRPEWDDLIAGIAVDGVVVPQLVAQLRNLVPAEYRQALHKGATSQDAIDTALMMQMALVFRILDARLAALIASLEALGNLSGTVELMAHTRMQRALPFTVADKLETWIAPLRRMKERLTSERATSLVIQLGGPIGNGGSFDRRGEQIMRLMADELDLSAGAPWHSQRDRILALGALMVAISGTLGKFGADVALMAQNEVGEIKLAGGGTSSAMAHKSNPVNAEILVSLSRVNAGLLGTLGQALVHENERSGAAWTLEWLTFPRMVVTAGASLRIATKLCRQLSF